jgi:carboxymethylenebutenolidase
MAEWITIMARDGHEFQAWLAPAVGTPKGAVIVIQEIFGVNSHIRSVTERFAEVGYTSIAPSLFDRVRRGLELAYDPTGIQEGQGYAKQLDPAKTMKDVSAALAVVRHAGRVGIVGYCWGGSIAYLADCDLPVACAVSYYGRAIVSNLDKKPRHPLQLHYGEHDKSIPPEDVEKVREANPDAELYLYPADHGFNCEQRGSYEPRSAALAQERTLAFFERHVAQEKSER